MVHFERAAATADLLDSRYCQGAIPVNDSDTLETCVALLDGNLARVADQVVRTVERDIEQDHPVSRR